MTSSMSLRNLTLAALIAALYVSLTLAAAPISYGNIQFRIAEALTLLPALTTAAVPGLFLGCFVANLIGGAGVVDLVFGSLATLAAAFLTRFIARKARRRGPAAARRAAWLLPVPPVVVNALVVGTYLPLLIPEIRDMFRTLPVAILATIGSVALGQAVVCYVLGLPLYHALKKSALLDGESPP